MSMTRSLAVALAIVATGSVAGAQMAKPPVPYEYSGTTAGLAPGSGIPLTFRILTWSSADDRQRVLKALTAAKDNKGMPDITKLLFGSPSFGQIWTEGPVGYALKYAHRESLPGGGHRVIVVTDRPLGSVDPPGPWKAEGQSEIAPFTVIELHVSKAGKGEGKMSLGVPYTINAGDSTVALENYAAAPITIRDVQLRRTGSS